MALPVDVTPPPPPPPTEAVSSILFTHYAARYVVSSSLSINLNICRQCRRAVFEQDLYKMPWQTRRLEMKGLTGFARV